MKTKVLLPWEILIEVSHNSPPKNIPFLQIVDSQFLMNK